MELWSYYRILRRRLWVIVICVVVCVGGVGGCLKLRPEQYRAIATVERQPYGRGVPVYGSTYGPAVQQSVEYELNGLAMYAMSATVRQRAVENLADEIVGLDTETLLRALKVEPVQQTEVLRIEVTWRDKDEARLIVKTVRDEFEDYYREQLLSPITKSQTVIQRQIREARRNLDAARKARTKFQIDHEITKIDDQTQALIQRTAEVESYMTQATASEGEAAGRVHVIDRLLDQEPEMRLSQVNTTDNPIYQQLVTAKVQVETELGGQLAVRGVNHPEVQALKKKLGEINAQIALQAPKIVSQEVKAENSVYKTALVERMTTEASRVGSAARRSALAAAFAEKKAEINRLPEQAMHMAQYDLDVKSAEQTYATLMQKLDEARVKQNEAEKASAFQTVDEPTWTPTSKSKTIYLSLAFLLSLMVGSGLALVFNYLDNSVSTPAEAEDLLGLPVMTVVPLSRSHALATRPDNAPLLASHEMLAATLESADGKECSTVLVASAEPEMGRSTTAANLAVTLAQDGARVILVDADMRKPTLHQLFGTANKPGLSNVHAGGVAIEDALVPTKVEGLLFMPAGPAPNSPIRLLRSREMEKFVQQVSALADFVVFDSPPGAPFADAAVIAAYVENVVIAHAAGTVPRGAEAAFRQKLDVVGVKVVGAVLNRVRPEYSNGYAYYRRFYGDASRQEKPRAIGSGLRAIPPRQDDDKD